MVKLADTPNPKRDEEWLNKFLSVEYCLQYLLRRIAGSYGVLEHHAAELGNADTTEPARAARMPAGGTADGGGVVAQRLAVMVRIW